MPDQKQSRNNGLWVKLVTVLLITLGYFGRFEFESLKDQQAKTEAKVIDIDKKLDVLAAMVGIRVAENQNKTTASNTP